MNNHCPNVERQTSRTTVAAPDRSTTPVAPNGLLTMRQASGLIAVTPHWLAALRVSNRGPVSYRTPIGTAIYYRTDLLKWLATGDR